MCDYDIHDCECDERYGEKPAETNTPETDAQANLTGAGGLPTWHIHADFARRIERERDINRRLYETECKDHTFMRKTLDRVISERDAALSTLSDMTKRHFDDQTSADVRWNKLRDERDEARELAEQWQSYALSRSEPRPANYFPWENA